MKNPKLVEVFTKLIPIYELAIKELPENENEWRTYVRETQVLWGLCFASKMLLDVFTYLEVSEAIGGGHPKRIAAHAPSQTTSTEVIENCLRPRLEFMQNYLK